MSERDALAAVIDDAVPHDAVPSFRFTHAVRAADAALRAGWRKAPAASESFESAWSQLARECRRFLDAYHDYPGADATVLGSIAGSLRSEVDAISVRPAGSEDVTEQAWTTIADIRDRYPRNPGDAPTDEIVQALTDKGLLAPHPVTDVSEDVTADRLCGAPVDRVCYRTKGHTGRCGRRP